MANYETLKTAIQQVIKTNGNNEITGALLQQSLLAMINSLGTGYQFIGVATPTTNPENPDAKVFYITNGKGTYTNFGNIEVTEDEVVVLYYDTEWHKVSTGIASQEKLNELSEDIVRFSSVKEIQGTGTGHRLAYWLLGNPKGNVIRVSAIKGDVGNNLVSIYRSADGKSVINPVLQRIQFGGVAEVAYDAENPYIYVYTPYDFSQDITFLVETGVKESLEERVENLEQNSGLFGKTIVCFGDSITEQKDNNGKSYSDYLAKELNAKVINIGVGGANLRQRSSIKVNPENFTSTSQAYLYLDVLPMAQSLATGDWYNAEAAANYIAENSSDDNREIVARAKSIDLQKVDIVTIFAGTNDFSSNNLVWGEDDSTNPVSIKGAVNLIVESLLSANPRLKIVFFTPIVRYLNSIAPENWSDVFEVTSEYRPDAATKNYFLYDIETKIQEACRHNHIPCCAWYWTLGWNKINFMQYFVAPDGTHPKNGYNYIGKKMATFLKSNL